MLELEGLSIRDVGVHEEKPVDYPDIAHSVAELVAGGAASRGIIIDGAGYRFLHGRQQGPGHPGGAML